MKKYPCEIIEDLIPLYIEGDVSNATKEVIESHLKECKNCSLLMEDYAVDDLEIESFKEDLPQAETFKTLMKRLKIWGTAVGILALIIAVAIGVFGYKAGESSNENVLTLKTVVKTFKAEGLPLKVNKSVPIENYILGTVKPTIYDAGDNKDLLLVYVFKSFGEKKEILANTDKFRNPFSLEEFLFHAKNVFIILKPLETIETREDVERIGSKQRIIREIVFRDLNEGKERVYEGESDSWKGTLTLKYYEHWFHDDGTLRYDSYYEGQPLIKYKKAGLENPGLISFEYKLGSSKKTGSGITVNKEGYIELAGGGSSGLPPSEDEEINFKIKWGDQEELLVLKASLTGN